jgi:hypothetical protein
MADDQDLSIEQMKNMLVEAITARRKCDEMIDSLCRRIQECELSESAVHSGEDGLRDLKTVGSKPN